MPQIAGDDRQRLVEALWVVDGKRMVRQMVGLGLGDGRGHAGSREAGPDGRQLAEDRAVAVTLKRTLRGDVVPAIGAGKVSVEIVEAAVLGIDHHHGVDLVDGGAPRGLRIRHAGSKRAGGQDRRHDHALHRVILRGGRKRPAL